MIESISRRTFLVLIAADFGGELLAPPRVVHAQPARLPLIAILSPTSASTPPGGIVHFKRALAELGWVEGRTVRFETRFGDWQSDRTLEVARELVALAPDVLFTHSQAGARAALQTTKSVPIVVGAAADLLAVGGISSVAHPGGNVTGLTHGQPELDRKRLEILKEAVPSVVRIAYLFQQEAVPDDALQALNKSGQFLNVDIEHFSVRQPGEIESAFGDMRRSRIQAVLVQDAALLSRYADRVTAFALKHRLPTISQSPRFAEFGGLLQYGAESSSCSGGAPYTWTRS